MSFFEHLEEFACRRVVFVRGKDVHIGFGAGTTDEGMDIVVSGFRVGEGRTIVFVTHDRKLGLQCPSQVMIKDGRIVEGDVFGES